MNPKPTLSNRLVEQLALRPDLPRAFRATVAFGVPLVVCHWLQRPAEAIFVAMAAQNLSLPDLRGAYRVRLSILACMTLVAAASAFLGVACHGSTLAAVIVMGLIAMLGGVWRHLSADYGPSLGITSALLFLLGLAQSGGVASGWHMAGLVAIGGLTATLLHAGLWLFRPQHPLRYAVAETWVAVSDVIGSIRAAPGTRDPIKGAPLATHERELRAALDRTFKILGAAEQKRPVPLITRLEEMRREVVHLGMRVLALNTALEAVVDSPDFARCRPVLDSALKALGDAARSVAVTLIMHRAENLATTSVRLKRAERLLQALDEQIASLPASQPNVLPVRICLKRVALVMPQIRTALKKTADHQRSLLNAPFRLPELSSRSIQSLASWMNAAPQLDAGLVRHIVRVALLTMLAVGIYKGFAIHRGYWIAFTIMVVLQPDYGATRQRAYQRIGGTVVGSLIASALLYVHLPLFLLDALAILMAFGFAYFLKSRYSYAIFFVTILIVFITETTTPVHLDFTVARTVSTLAGGALALFAARAIWPLWERDKFATVLAAAVRANRTYLETLFTPPDATQPGPVNILRPKRKAETANRDAAASLERLMGEPSGLHENLERATALTTYNQRLTRSLTVLAVYSPEERKLETPEAVALVGRISAVLESLAEAIEKHEDAATLGELEKRVALLETAFTATEFVTGTSLSSTGNPNLVPTQLAKTIAEIRVMSLALNAHEDTVEPASITGS